VFDVASSHFPLTLPHAPLRTAADVPSMVLEGFPDAPIGVLIAANVCIM
jgi:hypothetical protein